MMLSVARRSGGSSGLAAGRSVYQRRPNSSLAIPHAAAFVPTTPAWLVDASILRVDEVLYNSGVFKQNIAFSVALPDDYDSSGANYPVVYYFHGASATGENNRQIADIWPARYGVARGSSLVRRHISVFVNGLNYSFYCNNRGGTLRWADHFLKELIPYVHANYRTLGITPKQHLCAGFSMGAVGAFYWAFSRPDMFGGVHAYGPPMYEPMTANYPGLTATHDYAPFIISSDGRAVAEASRIYSLADRRIYLEKNPYGYVTKVPDTFPIRLVYGDSDPLRGALGTAWKAAMTAAGLTFPVVTDLVGVSHTPALYYGNADTNNMFAFFESIFAS